VGESGPGAHSKASDAHHKTAHQHFKARGKWQGATECEAADGKYK
jgi:hypothetical protein